MKLIPTIVLGVLLGFQAQARGDDFTRSIGEPRGHAEGYTLLFLFSPDDAVHQLHAEELEALSRSLRRGLRVVKLDWAKQASQMRANTLPGFQRHESIGHELLSGSGLTGKGNPPGSLKDRLGTGVDHALLFDAKGELVASGSGGDFRRIVSAVSLESATPTEVQVSTWGKVKEFFR